MTPDDTPAFTIGIEEEYLLVDPATGALRDATDALLADLHDALGDQVSTEFLGCQIEVGTGVCDTVANAQADLTLLRRGVARVVGRHGLAPVAASCHPWGDWTAQARTENPRYDQLDTDLGAVARRMLIGGMHVHVGIADPDTRIAVMNRMAPWLPVLLALSTSSPFWQGRDTGLASWRVSVFDGMPRTGLPPAYAGWDAYAEAVAALVQVGVIEDASKLWWDMRPSHNFPTLEVRICDVQPRLADTLMLAALVQGLARHIWRRLDAPADPVPPLILSENRWRAQRYGVTEGPIRDGSIVPMGRVVGDLLDRIAPDLAALQGIGHAGHTRDVAAHGTSACRQRAVRHVALDDGADEARALRAVVTALIADFAP
ncbi:carboxylate-amine ligase [Loktanella fryxellensis]|uniref:Putative glutamate--cysteine ligase 2 n=1 Tax=Loktanella fryxellensis TaxID=245187 RepID=A0A1H8D8E4_9RHOB|nr:carboxylate-amine ligase [Loktanella fryxellensis]SEN03540.1 carboxylate-amine ligase [Loktanella fryxellensis]